MWMSFWFLAGIVLPVVLLGLSACNSTSSSSSSGTGVLFVATQGDSSVSTFSIALSTGLLTASGTAVATGGVPSAMLLAPSGTALFIANSGTNDISAYSVKSDGSLTAAGTTQPAAITPASMGMDCDGKLLKWVCGIDSCTSCSGASCK
jgi:6-phosphogluconolactonase (cycloisomerase 2 family)